MAPEQRVRRSCRPSQGRVTSEDSPHLLIAGSTGAGESVALRTLLLNAMSLMTPGELRVSLVAPAPGELIALQDAPHLVGAVARHAGGAIRLLERADLRSSGRTPRHPVLLDEWQAVPEVLGAVKRAVDTNPGPGRHLLTGSVRADVDAPTWPGTGRLVRVPMFGMTIAEQRGRPDAVALVDRIASEESARRRPRIGPGGDSRPSPCTRG